MENTKRKSVKELRDVLNADSKAMNIVNGIFDAATFVQLGAYVKRNSTAADNGSKASDLEGVITGYGAVDGRLVFAFVQDSSRMQGAFGEAHAKKICAIYEMAMKAGAPVIGVYDSCGAKIEEGALAMAAYAKVMKKAADASGYIPQVAVISGVCAGSAAAIAAMSDFVIASDSAQMYVTAKGAGDIKNGAKSGVIDIVCAEGEIAAKTKELLMFLPQNAENEAIVENDDDLNRLTPEVEAILDKGDMKGIISALADNGKVLEIASDYAPEMIAAFVSLGGYSCGVVANDPTVAQGAITPAAADKAAGFINLCTSFGIPVVTLVDSVGADGNEDTACAAYASALASLAYSYAQAPAACITAVVGKAYGVASTVFGTKSVGADVVLATENAQISAMSPEAAVFFLNQSEIAASADPEKARSEKIEQWKEQYASPVEAARLGEVDDIVAPQELRQRILAAIEMMSAN